MKETGDRTGIVRLGDAACPLPTSEDVGAKAANLARMAAIGLAVPPAFVLPVEFCAGLAATDAQAKRLLLDGLKEGIGFLEETTGKRFGDRRRPLLVSVRSGAPRSMPGMLDTVLNVGCTSAATHGLIRMTGNPRFAWDCRRRLLEAYAQTVLGLDTSSLADLLGHVTGEEGVASERDLDCEALERLAAAYESWIEDADAGFEDDAMSQLAAASHAVCRSWMSDRARTYRTLEGLDHLPGTAVMVQAMVFGNRGLSSGSGVAFSRNPSTGAPQPVIDVLFDAQGEDVVSGRRTPETETSIAHLMPAVSTELRSVLMQLEREFGDMQDVEFTIEDGKLWLLQTRTAKRTPRAALRITVDLVKEGRISQEEALRRLTGLDLSALTVTRLVEAGDPSVHGIAASGGVAVGHAAFDSVTAERMAARGDPVILVRPDTSTADIAGFRAASGIVTATGGMTAHASLVARHMGKPCAVGCGGISLDNSARRGHFAGQVVEEGDWISVDGDSGGVFLGQREIITERPTTELDEVDRWRAGDRTASSGDQINDIIAVCPPSGKF
ncbi:MAG: pyruvate, phosphate dikinase [Acidobacteriia bacterium]|nr:pyruvate, phosphate dikinase [Terriglobia bacterium]